MMRSMFSGVSGLRVHQTKMDVIANNIANVNTVGFKAHRVTFAEVFYQKISGASGPNANSGRAGVNSMQIGLGSTVASISKVMTPGAMQRTDDPYDLMIDGEGFFVVGDNYGTYFTRAGSFVIDEEGNLATQGGLKVMGWEAIKPLGGLDYEIQRGLAKPIVIGGDKEYVDPSPTTQIDFSGNLNALTDPEKVNTIEFYDTVGNRYVVDVMFTYNGPGDSGDPDNPGEDSWTYSIGNYAYPNNERDKPVFLELGEFDATTGIPEFTLRAIDPDTDAPVFQDIGTVNFNTKGYPVDCTYDNGVSIGDKFLRFQIINDDPAANPLTPDAEFGGDYYPPGTTTGAVTNVIGINFDNIRQFGTESANATSNRRDGNKPGTLTQINVGPDGKITGGYSNGMKRLLGQIVVAQFSNPAGLEKFGDNLFTTTPNSGDYDGIGQEVQAGGGNIRAGVLEMSNVDLAGEFTEMITTQRGFQANSRVITTSDDMLVELVNLKR